MSVQASQSSAEGPAGGKLKILMICEFFNAELGFQENLLVKYYRKFGHDVTVVTSTYLSVFDYYAGRHDKSAQGSVEHHLGAKIVRLPFRYNLLNKLKAYRGVGKLLNEERPDLIFVHDITPNFPEIARYLRANPTVPMIMDFHVDYSNSGKNWLSLKILHGVIRKYFLDRARRHIRRYFPIVPAGFDFLNEVYKVPRDEMELLPLGADVDLVEEVRAQNLRGEIRARYGIPDDAFVIVTGGKLERRKRLELLAGAVRAIGRPDVHVLVAGAFPPDDPGYKAVVEEAAGEALPRIHFAGWLAAPEMFAHMQAADIAVFPASQSVLWLQAVACHLPLIVGDTGNQDVSYVNAHGNIVILRGNEISAEGLVAAIEPLILDPERCRAMAGGAVRATSELLDWNNLVQRTLRFNQR